MKQPQETSSVPSNVPNEAVVEAIHEVWENNRERDRIVAQGRNLLKHCKTIGIDVDALRITIRNKKLDLDEVLRTFRNTIHYMGLTGQTVTQAALFEGWDTKLSQKVKAGQDIWDAQDLGYQAGRHGVDIAECPYHPPGSELAAAWLTFHKKGADAAAKARGPDVSVATAPRGRRKPKQETLPTIAPARRSRARNGTGVEAAQSSAG